jgi:hypothetical protein
LAESGIEPAPERNRKRTWKHFLKSHWETLYDCDFFSVAVLGMFGTGRYMVFFVIEVKSRAVHIAEIRIAPDGAWMLQMARNLLNPEKLQPARGTVCEDNTKRVSGPLRALRRAASASSDQAVHRALSDGQLSPRNR